VGLFRLTAKISLPSTKVSLLIGIVKFLLVWLIAKFNVPDVAV
jgi:hypothetical protein